MHMVIGKPQFPHSKLKCCCSMPVMCLFLGEENHFYLETVDVIVPFISVSLCLWRSGDEEWNGLSHVPYSGKNDGSTFLAAVGPTGSIYSLCHMIHWQNIQAKQLVLQCDLAASRQGPWENVTTV